MNRWLEDLQHADAAAAAAFVELENEYIRLQADAHRATALAKAARLRVQKAKLALEPKVSRWRRDSTRPPGHIEDLADVFASFGRAPGDTVVRFGQAYAVPNPYVKVEVCQWIDTRRGWAVSSSHRLFLTGVLEGRRMVAIHPHRLRELLKAAGIEILAPPPPPKPPTRRRKLTAEEIAAAVAGDDSLRAALAEKGVRFR